MTTEPEAIESFACFGGEVTVIVAGRGPAGSSADAAAMVKRRLLEWHDQFSRFEPGSQLSQLNADPRATVPVSAVMGRLIEALIGAARSSGGLVDATLVDELEAAGYAADFVADSVPLARALELAPPRAPGAPSPGQHWEAVSVDRAAGTVTRPPGLRFDSGGIAKGLFGDILADVLGAHHSFAIDCAGDLRLGGRGGVDRPVQVESPFDRSILHVFELRGGAVATSGVGNRSWLRADGRPAHHLLDPATGRPAYTGVVQATALAPSGVEAEWRAKAALLAGPEQAAGWLSHGGVVVLDDERVEPILPGR